MSLPLGHASLGLAAYDLTRKSADVSVFRQWKVFAIVIILSNLPDIDILLGLLYSGNGELIHRGPTHSLLFAVIMGGAYTACARVWKNLPQIGFFHSSFLIGTHLLADYIFTNGPLSLLWPFELSMSSGFLGWSDMVHAIFFRTANDISVIMICLTFIIMKRVCRLDRILHLNPAFAKKTDKEM